MSAAASDRSRVRRMPKRGAYDRETIDAILDEAFVCHVGFVVEGQPFVLPTGYARDGDRLILHGSAASRMLGALSGRIPVCVTVTLVDGLVLARSAFHHSMNYRSVVLFGTAGVVSDPAAKFGALRLLMEHIVPGRWEDCRPPDGKELNATTVLEVPISEASAKVRTGPPLDDDADLSLPHWAGVLPLPVRPGAPVPDPGLAPGIEVPGYVRSYRRSRGAGTA